MELFIIFLTVLAYVGVGVGAFMIFMYIYAEHSLYHTPGGEIRQTLANIKGEQLTVKPVGKYVVILTISDAWLIAQWWV